MWVWFVYITHQSKTTKILIINILAQFIFASQTEISLVTKGLWLKWNLEMKKKHFTFFWSRWRSAWYQRTQDFCQCRCQSKNEPVASCLSWMKDFRMLRRASHRLRICVHFSVRIMHRALDTIMFLWAE